MQNTAIRFTICVNDSEDRVDQFIEKIEEQFKVVVDRGLELITVRHYHKDVLETLRVSSPLHSTHRHRKTTTSFA